MSGLSSLSRRVARSTLIPLILVMAACTPKDINPVRIVDPHPGLPRPDDFGSDRTRVIDEGIPIMSLPATAAPPAESLPPAEVEGAMAEALLAGDPWALRFLALRRLVQENLLTMADAQARFAADRGALLPLTQPPAPIGLDHPIPPIGKIVEAVRAVPPGSPRANFMVEEILPLSAIRRMALTPRDKNAAHKLEDRLKRLEQTGLITPEESASEAAALKELLDSGRLPDSDAPPPPAPAKPKPKGKGGPRPHRGSEPQYVPDPANFETPKIEAGATGEAGVHLMSMPDPGQGDKAWTTLKTQYPELAPLSNKLSRTDLGDVGVTWRLIAGPLSPADAAKLCEGLKAKGQECTPTPFPK